MWFKRKPQREESDPNERRGAERRPPRRFQDFQVRLVTFDESERQRLLEAGETPVEAFDEVVKVRLLDLCIQGSAILAGTAVLPYIEVDQVVGLSIEHSFEGWTVDIMARVRSMADEGEVRTRLGLEFLDPRDLQKQIDTLASGQGHFNGRRGSRVPFASTPLEARISGQRKRLMARVIDISEFGIGVLANHIESAGLSPGERVEYDLPLPSLDVPIQGAGRIVRTVRRGEHDFLGIAFAVRGGTLDRQHAAALAEHVQAYLDKRLRWSA